MMYPRINYRIQIAALMLLALLTPLTLTAASMRSATVARAQTPASRQAEAKELSVKGNQQYRQGKLTEALSSYQQALAIYQEIGDLPKIGEKINNIGLIHRKLGQYNQALKRYQQALAIFREIGDRRREPTTLHNMGVVYRRLGMYTLALYSFQQAIAIKKAPQSYQQLLEIYFSAGDRVGAANSLLELGEIYAEQGEAERARSLYEQALALYQAIGDRSGEADSLYQLGEFYQKQKQIDRALELYQQALEIYQATGNIQGENQTKYRINFLQTGGENPRLGDRQFIIFLDEADHQYSILLDDDMLLDEGEEEEDPISGPEPQETIAPDEDKEEPSNN